MGQGNRRDRYVWYERFFNDLHLLGGSATATGMG